MLPPISGKYTHGYRKRIKDICLSAGWLPSCHLAQKSTYLTINFQVLSISIFSFRKCIYDSPQTLFFSYQKPNKSFRTERQICNLKSIDKLPFGEICSETKKPVPFSAPYEYNIIRPECFVSSETKASPKIPSVVI